ncbi:hypothetical protein C1752_01527 [Acaryochloris thomasi RCC1774]|uniref:Uncharacterized protein n=1 Tax=Acaryochloris thomasi RCC1774 TaxID=1764569 RepID=A0A2W1JKG5_9CYAN|nr:hypothetical protein [Acaryochloris thomasi]PZD73706.1 hypothetical protein C1752_01527 [Acaryochloris thomasi RCC1774]
MSKTATVSDQRLGAVLQQAGLVSARQVEIALKEQQHFKLRIGELLALRGWLRQESADFFAEEWPRIQQQPPQQPIGQYLKQAGLLDEAQIRSALDAQRQTQLKFGTLIVANGWVQHRTLQFFLKYLKQNRSSPTPETMRGTTQVSEALKAQILENEADNPFSLLLLYQRIMQQGSVKVDRSPEQAELLRLGLVVAEQNRLKVTEGLAPSLADQEWIAQSLEQLHPYDAIRLKLFNLREHAEHPYQLLAAVLDWTGNQPELTQKLCQKIQASDLFIQSGEEAAQVAALVQTHVVNDWESSIAAQHLKGICDRIRTYSLKHLQLYERIVKRHEIPATGSAEEQELLFLGLIAKKEETLTVANRIYRLIFSHHWVTEEISRRTTMDDQVLPANPEPRTQRSQTTQASQVPSAEEVVSYLLDVELDPLPLTIDVPAEVMPERAPQPVAAEAVASSPTVAKTRSVAPWLVLCAIGGTAVAIGTQLWRPTLQPSPVASSSSESPETLASPNAPQSQRERVDPAPAIEEPPTPTTPEPSANEGTADRAERFDQEVQATATEAPKASPVSVVSTSDPSVEVPIFVTGSTQRELLETLGPPTKNWRGYYPNSKALIYKGIVPDRVDLGYLVSKKTGELRQTEIAFAQSIELETIQRTLRRLLGGELPDSVQNQLKEVYRRQADQYFFLLGTQEGEIHRDKNGWIYIGIWDADFH